MGKVIMSGIVPQLEEPISFDPVFANNTWEQIIKICQKNKVPDTWLVGDQKAMTINGTNYVIDIIGKNHDDYSGGNGKAPLTFQMHDCYGTPYAMNSSYTNVGGWKNCEMRTTHLPAILKTMPSEVQVGIKEVNKLTAAGGDSSTINTTADKLFLPSEVEVFGTLEYSYAGEGTQYEYYVAGNSVKKTLNGEEYWWRLRSPYTDGCFSEVGGEGDLREESANAPSGIAFAFCF